MRIFHELPVHQINYFGILKPVPLELSTLFMESYLLLMFCLIQCGKASHKLSCIFAFTCSRNANFQVCLYCHSLWPGADLPWG